MNFNKNTEKHDYNITSFINFPILIDAHDHPLLLSFCERQTNNSTGWSCDKCKKNYNYDTPSFYCTYCDFDLCQKCLSDYKLNQIKIYRNLNDFTNIQNINKTNFIWQKNFFNHNHPLSKIKRVNNASWKCNNCYKVYKRNILSYYCSLCDYDICHTCYNKYCNKFYPRNPLFLYENEDSFQEDSICSCSDSDIKNFIQNKRRRTHRDSLYFRKPVIYLYPEKEMDISIQLNIDLKKNKFTTIYPKFNKDNNIWNVHAKPNGDIQIKDKIYPYLFWEAQSYFVQEMKEGFIVKDENAEKFLEEKLKILGLNDKESTDFITFWLPILLKNKLSLCTFQTEKFFNNIKLDVNPKPDTMIRIFLSIKKIDSPINIKEQKLLPNERKGFTVIEWGGTDL